MIFLSFWFLGVSVYLLKSHHVCTGFVTVGDKYNRSAEGEP
ncbi:hypothetical protein D1AOALGA4SA_7873 [Olavius algarvensis Delta 1 endosymbiont]|nr:hypothetical protein D1AOALGA4SA_7873 [Olavius algarvensis Delta 1 endosymbiont]